MATRRAASLSRFLLRSPATATIEQSAALRSIRTDCNTCRCGTWKHYSASNHSPAKLGCFSSGIGQKRSAAVATSSLASKSATGNSKISIGPKSAEPEKDDKETDNAYQGPISSTIKKVKLLSLSTCCLSVSLGPVITFMTSPDMNVILKGGVASTVIFLSASTTAALHWFVSPYIHKLKWKPGSPTFDVEMLSWLATPISKTLKFSDVRPAETNRPFVTFKADANFYFIDADHCHNKALLAKLTPDKSAHESAFKNL